MFRSPVAYPRRPSSRTRDTARNAEDLDEEAGSGGDLGDEEPQEHVTARPFEHTSASDWDHTTLDDHKSVLPGGLKCPRPWRIRAHVSRGEWLPPLLLLQRPRLPGRWYRSIRSRLTMCRRPVLKQTLDMLAVEVSSRRSSRDALLRHAEAPTGLPQGHRRFQRHVQPNMVKLPLPPPTSLVCPRTCALSSSSPQPRLPRAQRPLEKNIWDMRNGVGADLKKRQKKIGSRPAARR